MHLLIALSQQRCAAACGEFFASLGWDVGQTSDPAMAARLLTFRRYDAVIADFEFDHWECKAGLDVARAARRREGNAVVVLMASALDTASAGLAAGADFVVQKPMALDIIADLIVETTTARDRRRFPTPVPAAGANFPD